MENSPESLLRKVGRYISGALIAAGPVSLYMVFATRPETAGGAWRFALAALGACVAAAAFRRRGARVGAVLVVAAALIAPKCLWMLRVGRCGMNELAVARERVDRFKQAHGRPPSDLEELGPLPQLRIWTVDEGDLDHFHPATTRVTILRGGAAPPDDGGWGYDPDQGRVFLSCTGMAPKTRSRALYEL